MPRRVPPHPLPAAGSSPGSGEAAEGAGGAGPCGAGQDGGPRRAVPRARRAGAAPRAAQRRPRPAGARPPSGQARVRHSRARFSRWARWVSSLSLHVCYIYIYIYFKGEEAAFKRRGSGGSRRTLPPCLQTQLLPCICNAKGKATSGEEQTRGWCGRGVLGIWKGQGALFLKLSIPSTPIVSASCKTSRAF